MFLANPHLRRHLINQVTQVARIKFFSCGDDSFGSIQVQDAPVYHMPRINRLMYINPNSIGVIYSLIMGEWD